MTTRIILISALALCEALVVGQSGHSSTGNGVHKSDSSRRTLSLDGQWQVAEGSAAQPPAVFASSMQVPGLVCQAVPALENNATESVRQSTFWLHRSFNLPSQLQEVAVLRIGQALYGFKVRINGQLAAENFSGQAPSSFDVRKFLKPGANDICIGVNTMAGMPPDRRREGAAELWHIVSPAKTPVGWDYEKDRYVPGITDSVELITAETPFVRLTQVVPEITKPAATVHVWLQGVPKGGAPVTVAIRQWKSGDEVGRTTVQVEPDAQGNAHAVATVEIPGGNLWTPEDPFLYTARITTTKDAYETRFGLRSFTFDPKSRRAILNGKPYFMRGTNYCLQRFMDDPQVCKRLPWDSNWVRGLHQKGKLMHWNAIRYCIGLMPQFWYDIADEEGFLIQNQYPVWTCEKPFDNSHNGTVAALAKDYQAMMEWQWNHPAVVIWDASNETAARETALAVKQVRHLDLSDRPWSNGWSDPERLTDAVESHPYYFSQAKGYAWLSGLESTEPAQFANKQCVVVNEYGWLWINRDGAPTTLTKPIYEQILGDDISAARCRHIYALFAAAETEFWRHARTPAAVMEFCMLAYCHSGIGLTSDHFLENSGVEKLELEPEFATYVRDAFAPVGVMIKYWKPEMTAGRTIPLSVSLINDLEKPWSGEVVLRFIQDGRTVSEFAKPAELTPQGVATVSFDSVAVPGKPGQYLLTAQIKGTDGQPVQSVREIKVTPNK